jgi:D-tyrosyl-tRNA(Tyr) deacylase
MKLVIQRVRSSSLYIEGSLISQIKQGLVVLIGISKSDSENVIDKLVKKLLNLRVFEDENSKMNYSILDIEGEILLVSQFTLYADTRKGNRPSFINAADPKNAEPLYNKFLEKLHIALGDNIKTGRFGANMQIELVNDGPVTIIIENS